MINVEQYGASEDAIQYHYDIGNDFLALAQEETRTYSAAMWEDGDTHEQAQIRKLDSFDLGVFHLYRITLRRIDANRFGNT